jgi:hypothetical protein
MPIGATIIGGAFILVLVWATWNARRLWRDEVDVFDDRPESEVRSYPTIVVGGLLVSLTIAGLVAIGSDASRDGVRLALVCATFVLVPVTSLLAFTTRRWGRPRALIPPHLRHDDDPDRTLQCPDGS